MWAAWQLGVRRRRYDGRVVGRNVQHLRCDRSFGISSLAEQYELYEPSSALLVQQAYESILFQGHEPFDITVRLHTPLGYKKVVTPYGLPGY